MATALITGASKRIGLAIARHLARQGHTIALHYNASQQEADEAVALIQSEGGKAVAFQADFMDPAAPERIFHQIIQTLGSVEVLINNASVFEPDTMETLDHALWERHCSVNLRAPLFLSQAFAKSQSRDKKRCIINVLDQRVLKSSPNFISYSLTKAALFTATKTMAQALAPHIRVNAVGPGPTLRNTRQSDDDFARQSAALLLGQGPSPDDIAEAVAYLVQARSVTGQMIAVDGGQHLAWETPDLSGIPE
jgi:NAD(P)-dependent dehydrogenase (short-subunit alcohol dehydrogenase family)